MALNQHLQKYSLLRNWLGLQGHGVKGHGQAETTMNISASRRSPNDVLFIS